MKAWRRRSLRQRILIAAGLGLALMMTLAVLLYGVALNQILLQTSVDAARRQADNIATEIGAGHLPAALVVEERSSRGSLIQLLSQSGAVVATNDPAVTTPLVEVTAGPTATPHVRELRIEGEGVPYALISEWVVDPSGTRYLLVVANQLAVETRVVMVATAALAVAALVGLALLLAGINVIVTQALRPVEQIRAELADIQRARTGRRFTVPASGDEIAALAGTMNSMLDRLAQADATTRQFISDASHELRSPLTTVRAATETLRRRDRDPRTEEPVTVIHEEVLRMQQLVDDLATLAKADDQALTLASADVDLDDLVDREARRIRATSDKSLEVHIEPVRVEGDELRLRQVLRNLTDNALRHAQGRVALRVSTEGGTAVVHVDNDGPPIPVPQRVIVFDRFARLHEGRARDTGGSGLGLAIARTLAERHGGTLGAAESPDGWCRFTLRLPAPGNDGDTEDEGDNGALTGTDRPGPAGGAGTNTSVAGEVER